MCCVTKTLAFRTCRRALKRWRPQVSKGLFRRSNAVPTRQFRTTLVAAKQGCSQWLICNKKCGNAPARALFLLFSSPSLFASLIPFYSPSLAAPFPFPPLLISFPPIPSRLSPSASISFSFFFPPFPGSQPRNLVSLGERCTVEWEENEKRLGALYEPKRDALVAAFLFSIKQMNTVPTAGRMKFGNGVPIEK